MASLDSWEEKYRSSSLLASIPLGKTTLRFRKNERIFSQGDYADSVYYVQEGQVKLTVVSFEGKEATLSVLGSGEFFGICCLGHQNERSNNASTLEPSTLIRIEKHSMLRSLRERPQFLEAFMACLMKRTANLQKDLCAQILDCSERRLAKVLLRLAELAKQQDEELVRMPKVSHDTLAAMVGTTRSRVTYFLNKFKSQGLVDYDKGILVRPNQLSMMLQEDSLTPALNPLSRPSAP